MYNTDFDMKRARYEVVLKRNYYRYRNGINTWNNQEYMESMYVNPRTYYKLKSIEL